MYKQLMAALLGQKFEESQFTKLEVTNLGSGEHNVGLEGQTFGIVQALCSAVLALSKQSGINVASLLEFIVCGVFMMEPQQSTQDNINSMIKHLEKCYTKSTEEK